jgi:phosphate acyltransferase
MRIALDAMGSDRAPAVEVAGAIEALRSTDADLTIVLVGDRTVIEQALDDHPDAPRDRIEILHAGDRIGMGDSPAQAIRRKPDSSIVVGLNLHKRGEADAFISAGSTGAVMAGSLLFLRALPGVDRPAIGTVLPTARGPLLLLDAGANVDTRPHHLLQFAHLGAIYAEDLMGLESPRVGLLNIGEEPEKGDERAFESHRLLAATQKLHFVGNVEGRDVVHGACDVLVCDGFIGNVLLKFYEAAAGFLIGLVQQEIEATGADVDLRRIYEVMDYATYGGAPLLGVNGVTIICHGGSPPRAICNAIRVAVQAVEHRMVDHIRNRLAQLRGTMEAP